MATAEAVADAVVAAAAAAAAAAELQLDRIAAAGSVATRLARCMVGSSACGE